MAQSIVRNLVFFPNMSFGGCRQIQHRWHRFLLHIAIVATIAFHPHCRRIMFVRVDRPPRNRAALLGIRGGATDQETVALENQNQTASNFTNNSTVFADGNITEMVMQTKRRRWFQPKQESQNVQRRRRWFNRFESVPVGDNRTKEGLLQHNETRGLLLAAEPTTTTGNVSSSLAISSMSKIPTANRGGALVKERPTQRQNWLLQPATKLVERVKYVQNIWWVNAWSEQLPTPHEEEEMERKQQEIETRRADEQRKPLEAETNTTEIPIRDIASSEAPNWNQSLTHDAMAAIETPVDANCTTIVAKDEHSPKRQPINKSRRKAHEHAVSDGLPSSNDSRRVTNKHNGKQHVSVSLPSNIAAIAPKGAYKSSGYWQAIDQVFTFGYARTHPRWRLSSKLRPVRKTAARVTGLHGALSGKPKRSKHDEEQQERARLKIAAIDRAKHNLDQLSNSTAAKTDSLVRFPVFQVKRKRKGLDYKFVLKDSIEQKLHDEWRKKRMKEIGKEMQEAQQRLATLACEKDVLQERHNPMWKYAVPGKSAWDTDNMILPEREFVFPSEELVDEYLDMLFATGRLVKLNHTDLWRTGNRESSDDDDELSGPSPKRKNANPSRGISDGEASTAGNWFLRNGLGELIGEKAELAAYKAVCKAIMEILAKALSNLHGLTVMDHSDIRIWAEETPQLPPIAAHIPGSKNYRDYAENAINNAIRNRPKRPQARKDNDFIQKAAIVESLTSQCQLAAPIMNLFPLNWQRAIISNVISLVTAVIADFCEGIEFQILGHKLSISFTPITQEEMLQRLYTQGSRPRRKDTEGFEEAVRATAETLSENLKLLDRWHERALGSGVLVLQISTLIARLVLFLVDDILSASRIDLWSVHTSGPRLTVGFEYRASTTKGSSR